MGKVGHKDVKAAVALICDFSELGVEQASAVFRSIVKCCSMRASEEPGR